MLLFASIINTLNEKELKYKVMAEGDSLSAAFGIIAQGKKSKVELISVGAIIKAKILGKEKELSQDDLSVFVDDILELKAMVEKENQLIKKISE